MLHFAFHGGNFVLRRQRTELRNILRHYLSTRPWNSREFAELESNVYQYVSENTYDPVLSRPLSELQWLHKSMVVTENDTLELFLRLPSLLHPQLETLKDAVRINATTALSTVLDPSLTKTLKNANVQVMATTPVPVTARLLLDDHEELLKSLGPGLASVSHIIGVYSCKGGVGKSTVAVNLAYTLAKKQGRVGLLDLDVYGPSLPLLVSPNDCAIRRSPLGSGMVYPIEHENLKLMSLGYANRNSGVPGSGQNNGAAIMKGLMTVKVVSQLLKGTDWGDLDVLILDLPPGTGDVQLAVLQQVQLSGAVAVSTPSRLAVADTRKGIEMFTSLGVPTIAVVENMAFFDDDTGKRHRPFGTGLNGKLSKTLPSVQLPISLKVNEGNEGGEPIMLGSPSASQEREAFDCLADHVSKALLMTQFGNPDSEQVKARLGSTVFALESLTLRLQPKTDKLERLNVRVVSNEGATQKWFAPWRLRSRDPSTGETIADSPFVETETAAVEIDHSDSVLKKPSPSLLPVKVERRGRYGYAVEWADGATIIYSMQCIAKAADATIISS